MLLRQEYLRDGFELSGIDVVASLLYHDLHAGWIPGIKICYAKIKGRSS
jgi:hypothetical protein